MLRVGAMASKCDGRLLPPDRAKADQPLRATLCLWQTRHVSADASHDSEGGARGSLRSAARRRGPASTEAPPCSPRRYQNAAAPPAPPGHSAMYDGPVRDQLSPANHFRYRTGSYGPESAQRLLFASGGSFMRILSFRRSRDAGGRRRRQSYAASVTRLSCGIATVRRPPKSVRTTMSPLRSRYSSIRRARPSECVP